MTPPVLQTGPLTASFQQAINQHLTATIPPGKTLVALGVLTPEGMQLGVALRVDDTWKLAAGVERAWSGDLSGQVVVMGSW